MKVKHINVAKGDRWWIPGDIHFDQQDDGALRVANKMMIDEGVNGLCLIGDTFNSMGVSRHQSLKATRHYVTGKGTLAAERDAASPYLRQWSQYIRDVRDGRPGGLELMEGNHEKWWSAVQDEFPGLLDTDWPELFGDLFDGWAISGENTGLKFGPLLVVHGHRLRGSLSKKSAYRVWQEYPGQNTLYGHTHRQEYWIGATMKDGVQEFHGAWTIGNMRDRDSELNDAYMSQHAERHQQGGALVSFFERSPGVIGFDVQLVPVQRDHNDEPFMVVNGVKYQ